MLVSSYINHYDIIRITTVMYTLMSFKYWRMDSLKMAKFRRNMQE